MDSSTEIEILVGVAEIAVALAGFSGVVVVFGSRQDGGWHPGDRLRLAFLLESGFTAGAVALLAILAASLLERRELAWALVSTLWAVTMVGSLVSSSRRLRAARAEHTDIDDSANNLMFAAFVALIALEIANAALWRDFGPLLAGLLLNLLGSCFQFGRLIRSAFRS